MKDVLIKLISNRLAQHSGILYMAHVLNISLGLLATILVARSMPVDQFGVYGFFYTFQLVGSLLSGFGFFMVAGRLLALNKNSVRRNRIIGAEMAIFFAIGFLYALMNLMAGYLMDSIFSVKAGSIFRSLWWLTAMVPVQYFFWNTFEGLGYIRRLAVYMISLKTIFLISIFYWATRHTLNAHSLAALYLIPFWLIGIPLLTLMKPSFKGLRYYCSILVAGVRQYGFHFFLSSFIGFLSLKIDQFFVSYFFGATEMGYYHLAASVSNPITLISKSFSTSAYKKMTQTKKFPPHFILIISMGTILGALVLYLVFPFLLVPVFTEKFSPLLSFFPLLLLYHVIHALRLPFSNYLRSQAKGKAVLSLSFILVLLVVFFQSLIRNSMGIQGPAVAMILANGLSFITVLVYYRYYKSNLR